MNLLEKLILFFKVDETNSLKIVPFIVAALG